VKNRAFVTGATGFVGGALVERLSTMGWDIIVLVRETSDIKRLKELDVTLVFGDLNNSTSFVEYLSGCSTIFHCAGLTGIGHSIDELYKVISLGTQSLLAASIAAKIDNFIFISSIVAYELSPSQKSYDEAQPVLSSSFDPYGLAKVKAEAACMKAHDRGDISVKIIRPVFIYGPGDRRGGFLPEIAAMIKANKFRLIGDGNNTIPLIYISDLIDLLMLSVERRESHGGIYNASSDKSPTWKQFVDCLCVELLLERPKSVSPKIMLLLSSLLEGAAKIKLIRTLPISKTVVKLLSLNLLFPSDKARDQLGFQSKVSFQQGISNSKPMLSELLDEKL